MVIAFNFQQQKCWANLVYAIIVKIQPFTVSKSLFKHTYTYWQIQRKIFNLKYHRFKSIKPYDYMKNVPPFLASLTKDVADLLKGGRRQQFVRVDRHQSLRALEQRLVVVSDVVRQCGWPLLLTAHWDTLRQSQPHKQISNLAILISLLGRKKPMIISKLKVKWDYCPRKIGKCRGVQIK